MKRRKEREFALGILYACEYNSDPYSSLIERMDEEQKKHASDFAVRIIKLCTEQKDDLDEAIVSKLQNWDYGRVAVIDRILLRMAMVEFLYFDEIPPEVSLDEVIEISKIYSTERSGKFINGVLDALLKQLREENRLNKSGRGLISNLM
ncbi:MAG: transcription antitermination factor NusB [Calditrichaceae bacterium]